MKILFLSLVLCLFFILQVKELQSSEEVFESIFFIKAIVEDKELTKEKRPKAFPPVIIQQLDDGNMEINVLMKKNGECQNSKTKLEKTVELNKFTMNEGKLQVYITKMSVTDHWIILYEGELLGEQIRVAKLLAPYMYANQEAIKEFKLFSKKEGFDERKIIFPRIEEECTFDSISEEDKFILPEYE
ncbi:late lactation protein B-like isoform X1 [Monodelphis domestica]|uniref:Late lactation protein B-like n=1 Tax=Monodelphis domestica TaxID=13616 RepID=A0A5F8H8Y8_MONDO|nr:late lactation protein B-like isoform X1 [Monodelphis domestica]